MEILLFSCVLISFGYLTAFLNETPKVKVNNFFSLLGTWTFTLFLITYISVGNKPENIENKRIEKTQMNISPRDSSGIFKNNTNTTIEVVEERIRTSSKRIGLLESKSIIRYSINEKKVTK